MSALPRVVKPERPDLSAFTEEQRRQLEAWDALKTSKVERVLEAVFRACIGIAREIKPGKRWDGL